MMADQEMNNRIDEIVSELRKAIEEFKLTYPGYISPEYERQFLNNFKEYLKELDNLDQKTAVQFTIEGIKFAEELGKSVENSESEAILFSLYSRVTNGLQIDQIDNAIIKNAILTADPVSFGHDPGVSLQVNKNARRNWYEFSQMNKHQLAKKYIENSLSKKQNKSINSIMWKKGMVPLTQFLEDLKNVGLIENRETEKIIQEHFKDTDKKPQPIKWSKSNRLIIYLFSKLSEADIIDTMDRQFQLIKEHFLDQNGKPFKRKSLKQDSQNMKYLADPRGSNTIDSIISKLTD